jgi:hypothetical protein
MLGTFIGVPRAFAGIAHFNQIERDHKAKRAAIARNEPRVYGHVHQSTGGRRARVTHYERTGEYLETELRDE